MKTRFALILTGATLALVGCGGGSSSRPSSPGGPIGPGPDPGSSLFNTEHLNRINAINTGSTTGSGVTVAVVDTGFNVSHDEINDGQLLDGFDATANNSGRNGSSLVDESNHGTSVSALVSGTNVGVAPSARIVPVRASEGAPGIFFQDDVVESYDYLLNRGDVNVINNSYGLSFGANIPGTEIRSRVIDGITNDDWVVVMGAGNRGGDSSNSDASSGGRYADDPDFQGQVLVVGSVTANNTISGFSRTAKSNQDIWGDHIGIVEHFLVAPGSGVCSANDPRSIGSSVPTSCGGATPNGLNESYGAVNGTSFAAPLVSGAVALLRSQWPSLDGSDVVGILLETATDLGDPGVDEVYGSGLLNVEEALQPQGTMTVATSASVDGPRAIALATSYQDAGPFGDALASKQSLFSNVISFDKYNRDYSVDLSRNFNLDERQRGFNFDSEFDRMTFGERDLAWAQIGVNTLVASQVVADGRGGVELGYTGINTQVLGVDLKIARFTGENGYRDGLADNPVSNSLLANEGFAAPWSRFATEGNEVAMSVPLGVNVALTGRAFTGEDDRGNAQISASTIGARWRPNLQSLLSFELGQYTEKGSLYGSSGSGALSLSDEASTTMVGFNGEYFITDNTELFGSAYVGATDIDTRASLLSSYQDVMSVSGGLGVRQHLGGDTHLGFAVSSPLRAESGSVLLSVPVARNGDEVTLDQDRVSLTPSGREIDIEAFYAFKLLGQNMRLNLLHRQNPGHIADAPTETAALVGFRKFF